MSPRDLAFRVLLLSIVRFSTTSTVRPQRLTEPTRSLEDIPDRWRTVCPKFKAPQIELQVSKSHVLPDKNWIFTNEYKYSGKDHDAAKITKDEKNSRIENGDMEATEKEKENRIQNNIVSDNNEFMDTVKSIASPRKFIITAPIRTDCPMGERKDSRGCCRIVTL